MTNYQSWIHTSNNYAELLLSMKNLSWITRVLSQTQQLLPHQWRTSAEFPAWAASSSHVRGYCNTRCFIFELLLDHNLITGCNLLNQIHVPSGFPRILSSCSLRFPEVHLWWFADLLTTSLLLLDHSLEPGSHPSQLKYSQGFQWICAKERTVVWILSRIQMFHPPYSLGRNYRAQGRLQSVFMWKLPPHPHQP